MHACMLHAQVELGARLEAEHLQARLADAVAAHGRLDQQLAAAQQVRGQAAAACLLVPAVLQR